MIDNLCSKDASFSDRSGGADSSAAEDSWRGFQPPCKAIQSRVTTKRARNRLLQASSIGGLRKSRLDSELGIR